MVATRMQISKSVYYGRGNGANAIRLDIGSISLWFSYETVIAFQDQFKPIKVRVNSWSNTTGKHLNAIDGNKKARISSDQFELELANVLALHGLII